LRRKSRLRPSRRFEIVKLFTVAIDKLECIIKQLTLNKSSLLLKIDLQNTQALQPKWKLFTKVIKRQSKEAWVG